ncbi:MAG: hypothetical protein ABIT20_06365 [Gemmatimonadaceae bacterium]
MFHSSMRARYVVCAIVAAAMVVVPARASGGGFPAARAVAAPTVKDFMRVLDAQIQRVKPRDVFRRTIVFSDVRADAPEGNVYPFTVTAAVHDYNPGWPPSHYFGKTCITRIVGIRSNMRRDRIGEWIVEMQVKMPEPVCTNNPTEGKSAFPLDSLRGMRVGTSAPLPERMTKKQVNVNLRLGEYACTYSGGGLASKYRFRLNRDKTYTDIEGTRGGTYVFELLAGTLMFHGGFLDSMGGKSVENQSVFQISPALTCAPWG